MNFEQAINVILKIESGYVSNPDDPGGETNFGISKRAYPDINIKLLTRDNAVQIYKRDYWDELRLDEMPEQIRLILLDCAINQGRSRAIKILQCVLGIEQDGILGPLTFLAFREFPIGQVFSGLASLRHNHYTQDVRWPTFGKGWSKRLLNIVLESQEII